jgi:hypothetical protein
MPEAIAVLSADTHLAQRSWAKHPGLMGDSYYGLKQLVDYCTAAELDLVLAGDVFDKNRPDSLTIWHTRTQIDRMERQDLSVYFQNGQHDLVNTGESWLNAISWWSEHIHQKQFDLGGIVAYGLDWTPADQIKQEFDKIPTSTDLLIAHQVWRDLMGPRIGESECAFADVPVVKMILTGDFHRHLKLEASNKDNAITRILSPGPVCMQSIDEDPAKYFFVLSDDMSIQSIRLKTRNCFRFNLSNKDDLEIFLTGNVEAACEPQQNVPDNIVKNIVHITYEDNIPEAYTRIINAINSRAHLFLVPIKQKQEIVTIETERRRALADGGMEACLELLTAKDSHLYRDVLSLLKASSPIEQLKTIKALFFQHFGENNARGQIHNQYCHR